MRLIECKYNLLGSSHYNVVAARVQSTRADTQTRAIEEDFLKDLESQIQSTITNAQKTFLFQTNNILLIIVFVILGFI